MVEILLDDEFVQWFESLDVTVQERIYKVVSLLEASGVSLGVPSSSLEGTTSPLRELRVSVNGRPVRIFYAFDVLRRAVLLCGGDKSGEKRFYETQIKRAERLWDAHCSLVEEEEL